MPKPTSIVRAGSLAKWVRSLLSGLSKSGAPSIAVVNNTTIIKEIDPDYIFPGRLKYVNDGVEVFPFTVIALTPRFDSNSNALSDTHSLGGFVQMVAGDLLLVKVTHNGTFTKDDIGLVIYTVNETKAEFEVATTIPSPSPATVTVDLSSGDIVTQNGLSEQWFALGWLTPDLQAVNGNLLSIGAGSGTYVFLYKTEEIFV
jgi:hypothetical protein